MSTVSVPDQEAFSADSAAGSPGAILRRCREFHEITLEEASETTKIAVSYLNALEEDRTDEFANLTYLKGFLRIYTTYLGLSSDDISRMYDKRSGIQSSASDAARTPSSSRTPRTFPLLKRLLFPAILLVLIVITAAFFKRPPPSPVRQPFTPPATVQPVQNAAIQLVQSSAKSVKVAAPVVVLPAVEKHATEPAPVAAPAQSPAEGTRGFILKIRVTQNGALTSTVDDSAPQLHELAVGDVVEWKAEKMVTLELSNAGGVEIELDGKPYKSLGPPGTPVYIEFDADGAKE
ncbi:MAG: DUF4115 domain-containing protein [Desulfuromonadaceae bacterium]|nr:DUF4115 domain-containing protein [Desulfuromonadaceae bacterium]MDD5104008.1 DUF4115 domain-containing protein [Desulfuromonadaceae bacterium]